MRFNKLKLVTMGLVLVTSSLTAQATGNKVTPLMIANQGDTIFVFSKERGQEKNLHGKTISESVMYLLPGQGSSYNMVKGSYYYTKDSDGKGKRTWFRLTHDRPVNHSK